MKSLRHEIQYKLETTKKGARIRITTKDPEALRACRSSRASRFPSTKPAIRLM